MKNYLGNLIARHMNETDVLLPRLASRFEPQSSVLQSDGFQVEAAEMDVAESIGAESDFSAPVSKPVAPEPASVGPASEPVPNVSVPAFVAPVAPIPSGIERRVEPPFPPSTRSPESVVESSDTVPSFAELTSSTTTADADSDSPTISRTTPEVPSDQDGEPTVSRVTSVSRVASESRSEASAEIPTRPAGEVTTDSNWSNSTDQVAVVEHLAEQAPTEPGLTPRPITTNEPLAAIEQVTVNEQVTEIDRVTSSLRAAQTKPNQPLTQRTIETQPAVSKLSTDPTETGRETVALVTRSEPFATATKSEPLASGPTSERFTFTVSKSQGDSSVGPSKPQQQHSPTTIEHPSIGHSPRELLSAVIVPEPKESSPVVDAARESQTSPKQPESLPDEARPTQRGRELETSVARSRANDPSSLSDPPNQHLSGSARLTSHNNIRPTDAGPTIEPGPTINVTIGRIEVRAATSEPRPQKQRREQQVLSLDEYLNQRSAGGR